MSIIQKDSNDLKNLKSTFTAKNCLKKKKYFAFLCINECV